MRCMALVSIMCYDDEVSQLKGEQLLFQHLLLLLDLLDFNLLQTDAVHA